MLAARAALETVLRDLPRLSPETLELADAVGRVLGESVRADRDAPPFRNSAMDGFAVRAEDIRSAGGSCPATLQIVRTITAGNMPGARLQIGEAARIMTGARIPEGADAVVRVEDTTEVPGGVEVRAALSPGANIREAGEEYVRGDQLLSIGHELRPADIGLLASLGRTTVTVSRSPSVAIISTGDELVDLGEPLGPGQITNSNAHTLAAAVREAGGRPRMMGIVRDNVGDSMAVFEEALFADVLISTGGVSMGTLDLVRQTLSLLGVQEQFWKVAQKPGKPLSFGRRGNTLVFALPGNPVSALVCFYLYVRPALRALQGLGAVHVPSVDAVIEGPLNASSGLTDFIRCILERDDHGYRARVTGSQSSGILRSMSLGNGLIVVPPNITRVEPGHILRVLRLAEESSPDPSF